MAKSKLEYIWLDGYTPTQSLRGKTMIVDDFSGKLEDCPMWSFDGSSTEQAEGGSSDCLLKPVACYKDPGRLGDGYLVMTEVLNADGSAHESNGRATIDDDDADFWFGFEQEYFLWDPETNLPIGFPMGGFPGPQGPYYCSVGGKNAFGRDIVEEHLEMCMQAGIEIGGINGEVAAGQWEFQGFAKGAALAGDEMWVARYLLERCAEEAGLAINWHPKPLGATDWNGSGMHANFSNEVMRTCGDKATFEKICQAFDGDRIQAHISVYGADNDQRLTGLHETQAIDKFSYVFLTVVLPSVSRLELLKMAGKAVLKIAALRQTQIPTRLRQKSSRPSKALARQLCTGRFSSTQTEPHCIRCLRRHWAVTDSLQASFLC